ncbi:MAG: Mur ligase family protein, partial [Chitinophagaceae bacterium]
MNYQLNHIAEVVNANAPVFSKTTIEHLLLDSRRVYSPATSLFFALKGPRRNGHQFITELYKRGVKSFVVNEGIDAASFPEAVFLFVNDTLVALQQLASYHRQQFSIPVIGITGSNGKTMVKEWLYQLLHEDFNIVRSPKSYNSQIGVPLSVWQINEHNTLGIFEAGISRPGEMEKLEQIIQPNIGVLTNIGEPHSEGFESPMQKEEEKKKLFRKAIMPAALKIISINKKVASTLIIAELDKPDPESMEIEIPFTDDASVQNAITCWSVLLHLNISAEVISGRMKLLQPVNMRLELKKGINNCSVINDSYSADLSSLGIALNFLYNQSAGTKKTVILSDFLQSGLPDSGLYKQIASALQNHSINKIIGIGEKISKFLPPALTSSTGLEEYFPTTEDFI